MEQIVIKKYASWMEEELSEFIHASDDVERRDALLDMLGVVLIAILAEAPADRVDALNRYTHSQIVRNRRMDVGHHIILRAIISHCDSFDPSYITALFEAHMAKKASHPHGQSSHDTVGSSAGGRRP